MSPHRRRSWAWRRPAALGISALLLGPLLVGCAGGGPPPVAVGMMYPTLGPQGGQGTEEQRGAELAAQWANDHGGVAGRRLEIKVADVGTPEDVPAAMGALQAQHISVVVGTHGSDYSAVAASEATRRHMLVWETGAVGEVGWSPTPMPNNPYAQDSASSDGPVAAGVDFIRMAPMGGDLGKSAVDFVVNGLASKLPVAPPLRWAVAYVDDDYGNAVAAGASSEVLATHQSLVGSFPYAETGTDFTALAQKIAAAHPQALYVAAYLADGTALRRALVAEKVPLVVNLGTSSSYCMPAFGQTLGPQAVGVYASDAPTAAAVRPEALTPGAQAALRWVNATYQARYHVAMSAHALEGFSNAFALFMDVLPKAPQATTTSVAQAAQQVKLPAGSLANGGGLDIAPPGAADAGNNRNATGVIWEWTAPGQEQVVWPPAFATHAVVWTPIDQ